MPPIILRFRSISAPWWLIYLMAMALSDGVNSSGENRRKILRRFMVRKNKKDTIKGTTEYSKWPEMWRNSNSHCLHFLFCRLRLSYSIWYLYCVSSASLWILLYHISFSGWSEYSGSKNEWLQLNCARNSAMHSPGSQMKCFAFVVASVSKRQSNMECQKLDFFIAKLVNDCPQLVLMYSVSGRSSKSSSKSWHE